MTIQGWYKSFREGTTGMGRKQGDGRPPNAVTSTNITAVSRMVDENPRVTYAQIQHELGIGGAATNTILKGRLGLRKLCSRWVPHGLTAQQMEARREFCKKLLEKYSKGGDQYLKRTGTADESWCYYYDPLAKMQSMEWVRLNQQRSQKIRRARAVKKQMLIIFFNPSGVVSKLKLVQRQKKKSVDDAFYVKHFLKPLLSVLRKKYPKRGMKKILFQHDNAPSHTASFTKFFRQKKNLHTLPYLPYFPDLAPCDFFLFRNWKNSSRGGHSRRKRGLTAPSRRFSKIFLKMDS